MLDWLNRRTVGCLVLAAAAAMAGSFPLAETAQAEPPPADSAEWPGFLGPDRNGLSRETGLLKSWPADGPPEVWRVPGGQGMSGLAISGGRLFTMVQKGGRQLVLCLDARTGKSIWEAEASPAYKNPMGDGPRATPAVDGTVVYVLTGDGVVAAYQVADGKLLWSQEILEEFGGKPADYGMAGSPLVVGDRVIVIAGAPQATVVALSRVNGAVSWTAGMDSTAGYSSPTKLTVGGRDQIVAFHGKGALGIDPESGGELWSFPYITDFDCNIATPLAVADGVFLSAGENHGSVLLSLKPKGGRFEAIPKWESHGPKSTLRNEWQTAIHLGGKLYGFDNVGGAGPVSHLTCIDAASGQRLWQQTRFGKGNLIAADGKLWIVTLEGELAVVEADPKTFRELGRKPIVGKTRQAPSLASGLLYLRDDRQIVCLDVREK